MNVADPDQARRLVRHLNRWSIPMKHWLKLCLAAVATLAAPVALAFFHTFQVEQIYSNASGTVQFVTLTTSFNGENFSMGEPFTSSDLAGNNKTFTFPRNLPSSSTAGKRVLIATESFAALGIVAPDFIIPDHFIPTGGGTVGTRFSTLSYGAGQLPTDGANALYRTGVMPNLATNFAGQSASISAPPPPATPDLDQHGLTGSWFEPATNGQGFEIEVFPDLVAPGTGSVQLSWFTFDTVAGGADRQRWYTLSGNMVSGQPNASLTIYQNTGGNFNAPPITNGVPVGTATLSFDTCTSGQLTYAFTDGSGRAGSIPLTRITQNVTCSTTGARPANADFAFSGNWFDSATSGQGFVVEVNPNNRTVFVPWYTYAPGGAGAGAAGQRWYTALASSALAPGSRSIPLDIFETTGGVFDSPPARDGSKVGTGTLAFQSCSTATFAFNFTGGSSAGASGTIALTRVGPVPPGCAL
jgi:hypothetical protein